MHTTALKVYGSKGTGISASWAKGRFNCLKKKTTDEIRSSIFQVLASSGYGQLQGSGSKMLYIPYSSPIAVGGTSIDVNQSKAQTPVNIPAPTKIGAVGEKLVGPPTVESQSPSPIEESVGEIGGPYSHQLNSAYFSRDLWFAGDVR